MQAKFSDLIAYFKNLATKHVNIQHSENKKKFFRMEVDEVLAGINRTDCNYPMVILEGFGYGFSDKNSDNLLKNREGGFILYDKISDVHDFDAKHLKWDFLESIGDDFLMKIKADKRNPNTAVVRDFSFASVDASLISNEMGNGIGIRYLFTIASPIPNDVDNAKWIE